MTEDQAEQWIAHLVEAVVREGREDGLPPIAIRLQVHLMFENVMPYGWFASDAGERVSRIVDDATNHFLGEESYLGDSL